MKNTPPAAPPGSELTSPMNAFFEKAKLEARKKGHGVFEQPLSDGSIKLTIQVAGGAA